MTTEKALREALGALISAAQIEFDTRRCNKASLLALNKARAALSLPETVGEPVATVHDAYDTPGIEWHCKHPPAVGAKLYVAPPSQPAQGMVMVPVELVKATAERLEKIGQYAGDLIVAGDLRGLLAAAPAAPTQAENAATGVAS